MGAVGALADGATVIDCPCGAGPALRALPADASVRYVAADRSPAMLRRARKRAEARGLTGIVKADSPTCRWRTLAPTSSSLTGVCTASRTRWRR